jgi:hypothetical protein
MKGKRASKQASNQALLFPAFFLFFFFFSLSFCFLFASFSGSFLPLLLLFYFHTFSFSFSFSFSLSSLCCDSGVSSIRREGEGERGHSKFIAFHRLFFSVCVCILCFLILHFDQVSSLFFSCFFFVHPSLFFFVLVYQKPISLVFFSLCTSLLKESQVVLVAFCIFFFSSCLCFFF